MMSRNRASLVALTAVAALLAAGCGRAAVEATLDETFSVDGLPTLEVLLPRGDITVETHDEGAVIVSAAASLSGGSGDERAAFPAAPPVRVEQDGTVVRVRVEWPAEARGEVTVDVHVTLPSACDLELRTERGDIAAQGVRGTIRASTARGDIDLRDLEASVTAVTERGIVIAHGKFNDGEHTLRSSRGRIELWLHRSTCARILAETTRGKIEDSNLMVRGSRRPDSWDVSTYCSSGASFQVPDDPPVTLHLLADPGNVYLLTWYDEEE